LPPRTSVCCQCATLLQTPNTHAAPKNDQGHAYTAAALPEGARLWSKAGWTSQACHDAAYVELPNGAKFVLVIFTVDHANEREIIPTLARPVVNFFASRAQPEGSSGSN